MLKEVDYSDAVISVMEYMSLCTGEMDHLPEVAFYMVGAIEEVVKKAERLAEERR